jgi:hypothetical protein
MSLKAIAAGLVGYLATSYVGNKFIDKAEGVTSEELAHAMLTGKPVGDKVLPHIVMIPVSVYAGMSAYEWAKKKR